MAQSGDISAELAEYVTGSFARQGLMRHLGARITGASRQLFGGGGLVRRSSLCPAGTVSPHAIESLTGWLACGHAGNAHHRPERRIQ
ncbi:hypothetical protein [Mycolicibacterium hippocampi]|uniref:Uncharacterized protein n=1 Tax=Mycolicibacterium hippocampi TaxID=659824 RepID=A0A7I9ZTF8_9MYCO|nr:hypothetical protein [Mycolicibacterium hippocampi]GFH03968.1 hypothetical protein MHIP_44510 [Mycolicibacterium hippocampi]